MKKKNNILFNYETYGVTLIKLIIIQYNNNIFSTKKKNIFKRRDLYIVAKE